MDQGQGVLAELVMLQAGATSKEEQGVVLDAVDDFIETVLEGDVEIPEDEPLLRKKCVKIIAAQSGPRGKG